MAASSQPNYAYNEDAMLAGIASFKKEQKEARLREIQEKTRATEKQLEEARLDREIDLAIRNLSSLEFQLDCERTLKAVQAVQHSAPEIIAAVASRFKVALSDLMSQCRTHNLTVPRHVVAHMLRTRLGWSTPRIGRTLKRHHATVLHSLTTLPDLREKSVAINAHVTALEAMYPVVPIGR